MTTADELDARIVALNLRMADLEAERVELEVERRLAERIEAAGVRRECIVVNRDGDTPEARVPRQPLEEALESARSRTAITGGSVTYVVKARDVGPWREVQG